MNDEELRQAMQALESYNQQLESVNRQARILQSTRDENNRASRTIQALIDAKEGDEILVPVGASCFITVKVSEKKKAVIGVGNKLSVEKDLPEAMETLENNAKELSEALQKTLAAMQEIQKYVEELTAAVQNEYGMRRQQELAKQ
ncbi:MAG: prefoldin subunit alpha [archaeon]|nr:prefoldin subunit alpha [archaeon]